MSRNLPRNPPPLLSLLAAVCVAGSVHAQDGIERPLESPEAQRIRAGVEVLADDSLRGRATPSAGLDGAARYVASELGRLGLRPLSGGELEQRYVVPTSGLGPGSFIELRGHRLNLSEDMWIFRNGVRADVETLETVVAWGGDGDSVAGGGRLDGKLVVALDEGAERTAIRSSPAAVLLVRPIASRDWERARANAPAQLVDPNQVPRTSFPILIATPESVGDLMEEMADQVNSGGGVVELGAARVDLRYDRSHTAPNVVAVLRGSSAARRNEYIVVSAHMDHLGAAGDPFSMCNRSSGDMICNGADDNASGTSALLEVARMLSNGPRPARSVMFLVVSGEERGLWGSEYFLNNLTIPTEQLVANLNIDMVGRNEADTIYGVGMEYSQLGDLALDIVNRRPEIGLVVAEDRWPGERFFFRSDHFNFAREGIPALFFFGGSHREYHRVTDHIDLVDMEKAARVARLVSAMATELANSSDRPEWKVPISEITGG